MTRINSGATPVTSTLSVGTITWAVDRILRHRNPLVSPQDPLMSRPWTPPRTLAGCRPTKHRAWHPVC